MKSMTRLFPRTIRLLQLAGLACLGPATGQLRADLATVLFQDDFTGGIPGWTAVQPTGGAYVEGPMLWEYDKASGSFGEHSNIYTDSAAFSSTRIAVMLINDTVAPSNFTYTARLTAGDDDGFGLIFGYQNETTFYRAQFARQSDVNRSTHWPYTGWNVDLMEDRQITDLFGASTSPTNASYVSFVNTAGRPFDVTLSVTNNRLTLTVVDDPDGAPVVYNLVADEPLPSSAAGKVGMFSWGMSGTVGGVRSFRVQNPVLIPTPLAGDPAKTVLTNWSFLITPRGDGGTPVVTAGGPPVWAQGLSLNGDRGTMIENSDWTADNTAPFTTNFAAPTAVAGDVNWSNYVYSARIVSADNDGLGMLLHYQNETNFYRIAFRNQASAAGIKQGISIQRNVNLNFDQIFASTSFLPPIYTAFDVHASIRTNRLQIVIVSNPLGAAPQFYALGPFDLDAIGSGSTVNNGKIGVFSWAQFQNVAGDGSSDAGTEFDFVRVSQVKGEGLLVSSAYGTPDPPVGLNDLPISTVVTAKVDSVVVSQPGVRRISTGWSGVGSVPTNGVTNEVVFTLSTFSSVFWKWRSEYELSVSATPGGTVNYLGTQFVPEGTNLTLTATPNPGNVFLGWSGKSLSPNTNLALTMTGPVTLQAKFAADSDGDGLPDAWELMYFGNLSQGPGGDPDGDGKNNLTEFQQGTDPTFAGTLVFSDGLTSRWTNEQRDPALPGQLVVVDFGSGYRGAYDESNDNRAANDSTFIGTNGLANYASFQSPIYVIRSNLWTDAWGADFSAQIDFTVGDNDGNCFYFRYQNLSNWYRVTIQGQADDVTRPRFGLSVQLCRNGIYSELALDPTIAIDPLDFSWYKRVRITVNATGGDFDIRAKGWNWLFQDFDLGSERVLLFSDASLATGRIGFGFWGQGSFGFPTATNGIPVSAGALADNIIVKVGGSNVFVEDWETATLATNLPPGWTNPYADVPFGLVGDWRVTADGTIGQLTNNFGTAASGTVASPKADVEGPILLAPPLTNVSYLLELGIHPFDDDGIGFVYDFADTNNFARVLFDAQVPLAGNIPQGLSVSRKSGGVWSDVVAGDTSFVYTPGRPFEVRFANNNGSYTLTAWNSDAPTNVSRWQWTGAPTAPNNRFGLAVWAFTDAHFTYVRASSLTTRITEPFKITGISVVGANIVLNVAKPSGVLYHVQRATTVGGTYVNVATNQSGAQYTEPRPAGTAFYRLMLAP